MSGCGQLWLGFKLLNDVGARATLCKFDQPVYVLGDAWQDWSILGDFASYDSPDIIPHGVFSFIEASNQRWKLRVDHV